MHSSDIMSNESEEDQQVIVDKLRTNYPDLTLNDRFGKQSFSSQNNIPTSPQPLNISAIKTTNHPISIVPASGSQNYDTSPAELKQVFEKKLPPYTNTAVGQNPVRVCKNPPKTVNKVAPQKLVASREKSTSTAVHDSAAVASSVLANNKSVTLSSKAGINCGPVPRTSNQISIHPNKTVEKTAPVNIMSSTEDSNSTSPKTMTIEQLAQLQSKNPIIQCSSEIIGKNINNKVLTVTTCSGSGVKFTPVAPSPVTTVKDIKQNTMNVVSKTVTAPLPIARNNTSPTENLLKGISKNVSVRSDSVKNESPKVSSSLNNVSKPVIINTCELSKNILTKSMNVEPSKSPSPKMKEIRVAITSTSDSSRTNEAVSKSIPSRNVSSTVSSSVAKLNPKTSSISVTSNLSQTALPKTTFSETLQLQAIPASMTNNRSITVTNLQISPFLEKNKSMFEALNAGTDFNLTESVTISNPTLPIQTPIEVGLMLLQAVPESKLGSVSNEAIVQNISKQVNLNLSPGNVNNPRNNPNLSPANSRTNSNGSPSNVGNLRNGNPAPSTSGLTNPRVNPNPSPTNSGNPRQTLNSSPGNPGNPRNPNQSSGNPRSTNPNVLPANPGNPRVPTTGNPRDPRNRNVMITEISSLAANPEPSSPQEATDGPTSTTSETDCAGLSSPSYNDSRNSKHEVSSSMFLGTDETDNDEGCALKRRIDEPECLTISSDDETEEPDQLISSLSDTSEVSFSIMNKEPSIGKYDDKAASTGSLFSVYDVHADGRLSPKDLDNLLDITTGEGYINLNCRTVRIGSYKVTPRTSVTLSQYGLKIVIPAINNVSENVVLKIAIHEIIKVLIHFGRKLPVVFYYVSPLTGAKVRNMLGMTDSGEFYFDPASTDESQRRITLLPEKFSDLGKSQITKLYLEREILADLDLKEANELLVRSAPRDVRRKVQKVIKHVPHNPVQTIMVYPPPPAKGGISINTEDYSCLQEDVFLNDVIIDFYLKYLYNRELTEEDKQKTHIFSSFFYKRLTDKATPIPRNLQNAKSGENTISPAEIRHSRVKNWTKNIDLFSKDYIIIPLNENQHWFLAIICFPGLKGPITFKDNKPVDVEKPEIKVENTADSSSNSMDGQTITIGSTTITPLRVESAAASSQKYATVEDDNDGEDRDEADGADEDVNLYLNTSEESEDEYSEAEIAPPGDVKPKILRIKPEREPIKQPCILIFDSLAGASRARIIATLRDYLRIEYKVKHKEDRDFSKNVVKGACPRVPQQDNYTDCGLFVLQYVESFFENKITDFHIPIKMLRNWFDPVIVSKKRHNIQKLLHDLMTEQHIDIDSLNLPQLNLSPRSYESEDDYYCEGDYYEEDDGDLEYDELALEHVDDHQRIVSHYSQQSYDSDESDFEEAHYRRMPYDDSDVDDDGHEMDGESDEDYSDDDIYKNMDIIEDAKPKPLRRTALCRRVKVECDEEPQPQEEDSDEHEHTLSNERLCGVNPEDITISPAVTISIPANTRSRVAMAAAGEPTSTTTCSDKTQLAALKAARPFGELDSAESGCSSSKKFRPN